jgi:hypothetical protein
MAYAQSETIGNAQLVMLVKEEKLALTEKSTQRLFIQKENQLQEGKIRFLNENIELTLPGAPKLELTRKLETAVSLDGKTIVQYGDEQDQSHPTRTNIFWKDSSGKIIAQVAGYYAERALVALSSNGGTAIVGRLFNDRSKTVLSLYSALGQQLWEATLRPDQRGATLKVSNNGEYVVLATTDQQQWLTDHELNVFDKSGNKVFSTGDFRVIQKVVVVDDDHLFVQGYDDYGVVRISSDSILWKNEGKIRMTSPQGATISPDGQTLLLSLADFRGKRQRVYRWRLIGLNIADGKEAFSAWLPGEFPGTRNPVFEQVSADRIIIQTDSMRLIYSWKHYQEEN